METRPWGHFKVLAGDDHSGYKIKSIVVNPGQKLSLQSHKRRTEFWVVVNGIASVTKNTINKQLSKGESITINIEELHRLANDTTEIVEIIEVQIGDYLGEDDIIRYEDNYGRV